MRYLLSLCCCVMLSTAFAENNTGIVLPGESLVFGVRAGMPANYFNHQAKERSSLVMLVDEVFKPLGLNIQYEELPRRRLIHSALRGDISVFTLPVLDNPIVNIQVPEGIILGDQALFSYPLNFYTLKRRHIYIEKPDDIVDYTLGLIKEAKFLDAAVSRVVDRKLSLVTFHRPSHILKALFAERVDIIMLAEPIFQYELSKLKANEEISLAYSIGRSGRHLAFSEASLGKEKALQLKAFTNRRLQDLKDKGVLQIIAQDYLNAYDEPSED